MPPASDSAPEHLPEETAAFYRDAMRVLQDAHVPFLVGGAYAFGRYTGIERHTKDFDVFLRETDVERALEAVAAAGYETERAFPHWLAKIHHEGDSIDLIYCSGNGLATVDDVWFERAVDDTVLGVRVMLCPPEEIVWTKALIMERERYDGADVAHMLLKAHERLHWDRLIDLFGPYWHVLLAHLVLFQFIYPSERDAVPGAVLDKLLNRLRVYNRTKPTTRPLCQGTLISRAQYLIDVEEWGYVDARLKPLGEMTPADIAQWTDAIDREE